MALAHLPAVINRFLILALLALNAVNVEAQRPSLRELARRGDAVVGAIGSGWLGPPFEGIARNTDLVIEGTVIEHHSYPTPDDTDIFTDFQFSVKQIIFQRTLQSNSRPGPAQPFVFKRLGGTYVFDGFPLTVEPVMNGKKVTLTEGDHVVILAKYDAADGKWLFGPWDVFYTSGELVVSDLPVLDGFDEGLTPMMSIEVFASKVREVASKR
jgi:hypothetical protein